MLREILTTGFIDKNNYLDRKKIISPGKTKVKKISKNPSIKSLNYSSKKPDIFSYNSKPIMGNKIDIIMKRPDYLIGQNNDSTMQTTSINKQYIYSNEITKNLITPKENENLNLNMNMNNIYNINNNNKQQIEININNNKTNISQKNLQENIKENNLNKINDINQINNILNKKSKNEITTPEIKSDDAQNSQNNSKSKSKTENNKSIELNMSLLSAEGIDKLKLLEEYILQIKENSTNVNEKKIQQLQNKKINLENQVNILSNNIRLNKKKYKDNIKLKKNLEQEKERVQYDSNKANKDAFTLMKELPNNKAEIEIMKNQIAQAKEETKYINNYAIDIERQTMEIQDEIKKINVKISNINKERDKISNEINYIEKKCSTLRSKIDKAEKSANEFLYNVGQLAKMTQQNKI